MSVNVYGPQQYKEYVQKNLQLVCNDNKPCMLCVENALVCVRQKRHIMGVYDADNKFVESSSLLLKNNKKTYG